MSISSDLTSSSWWKAAGIRVVYTVLAIVVAYLLPGLEGGFASIQWVFVGSAAAMGAILSLLTSLAGLPETVGKNVAWWLAALERVSKTFAQALLATIGASALLHEVDWSMALQTAGLAALVSLFRLILATLSVESKE